VTIWPERTARDRLSCPPDHPAHDQERGREKPPTGRTAASKGQRRVSAQTLKAAEFILLVTSLDADSFSAADILALYRRRWQVELAFKTASRACSASTSCRPRTPPRPNMDLHQAPRHLLVETLPGRSWTLPPVPDHTKPTPRPLDLAHPENAV